MCSATSYTVSAPRPKINQRLAQLGIPPADTAAAPKPTIPPARHNVFTPGNPAPHSGFSPAAASSSPPSTPISPASPARISRSITFPASPSSAAPIPASPSFPPRCSTRSAAAAISFAASLATSVAE